MVKSTPRYVLLMSVVVMALLVSEISCASGSGGGKKDKKTSRKGSSSGAGGSGGDADGSGRGGGASGRNTYDLVLDTTRTQPQPPMAGPLYYVDYTLPVDRSQPLGQLSPPKEKKGRKSKGASGSGAPVNQGLSKPDTETSAPDLLNQMDQIPSTRNFLDSFGTVHEDNEFVSTNLGLGGTGDNPSGSQHATHSPSRSGSHSSTELRLSKKSRYGGK